MNNARGFIFQCLAVLVLLLIVFLGLNYVLRQSEHKPVSDAPPQVPVPLVMPAAPEFVIAQSGNQFTLLNAKADPQSADSYMELFISAEPPTAADLKDFAENRHREKSSKYKVYAGVVFNSARNASFPSSAFSEFYGSDPVQKHITGHYRSDSEKGLSQLTFEGLSGTPEHLDIN